MKMKIRNEKKADYREVEELLRDAFWDLYVPGCVEHYVAHVVREHPDFIPELDLVLETEEGIIGSILYTKAKLVDAEGNQKDILTFGPVAIRPGYQRKGYGKALIEHSFEKAIALEYDVVVIFGNPANYVGRGFQSCKKHQVSLENGRYPAAMLVKELRPGALEGKNWIYYDSPA